jgi:hypothetical protein
MLTRNADPVSVWQSVQWQMLNTSDRPPPRSDLAAMAISIDFHMCFLMMTSASGLSKGIDHNRRCVRRQQID